MIIIFLLNEITTIQNIDNFLSNIGYLFRSIRYFFLLFSIFVHHYVFSQQNNVNNSRHENYCIYYHSKLINHQKPLCKDSAILRKDILDKLITPSRDTQRPLVSLSQKYTTRSNTHTLVTSRLQKGRFCGNEIEACKLSMRRICRGDSN